MKQAKIDGTYYYNLIAQIPFPIPLDYTDRCIICTRVY